MLFPKVLFVQVSACRAVAVCTEAEGGSVPGAVPWGGPRFITPWILPCTQKLPLPPSIGAGEALRTKQQQSSSACRAAAGARGSHRDLMRTWSTEQCTGRSHSKQNIVLYETIKKVPEGSPKYILYFTLNPCFDLTL